MEAFFWLGVPLLIVFLITKRLISGIRADRDKKVLQAHLKSIGYTYSFVGYGMTYIGFNPDKRTVVFGNVQDGPSAGTKINYEQVINYEWKWLESNGKKKDNTIVFYTNEPEYPIHKIEYWFGTGWCEKEFATIQAVMSR